MALVASHIQRFPFLCSVCGTVFASEEDAKVSWHRQLDGLIETRAHLKAGLNLLDSGIRNARGQRHYYYCHRCHLWVPPIIDHECPANMAIPSLEDVAQ